jgi:putative ABC transport system ATP-binding protein
VTLTKEAVLTDTAATMTNGRKTYTLGGTVVHALDDVSVAFEKGAFTAIMGPSGSGKSTLLHTIAGLDSLDAGDVQIDGQSLQGLSDRKLTALRRKKIGFVFQSFNLVPTLTARENIVLPLTIAGEEVDEDWFDQVVGTVGLADRLSHLPSELSGGQQQRVAAARGLVTKPAIIFADEPSGNLDSSASSELLGFMQRASREYGQTIVMVTHEPSAAAYADRVLFLQDGRVVGHLDAPTAESVLDEMKQLGGRS